ncbi:peroxidase 5-like protein [Corchorus olitorius]|uniref:Peroxidase 5-like protein n=1 Tax=Corchorus olitorius TaxID=93759 RepID=A0A1R3GQ97_9ROSI|nr:peroxidase 5-like protein [Corchorus olitorius]
MPRFPPKAPNPKPFSTDSNQPTDRISPKFRQTDPSGNSIKTPIPISLESKATQIKSPDFNPRTLNSNFHAQGFREKEMRVPFRSERLFRLCGGF